MPSDADFLPMASPFDVVRKGGYNSAQVDDWLARADADLRVTAADRDAAASQAAERASQLDAARAEIEALQ
ncbi:MAG: M protein, partial [Actinomycetota bacterium]|nr:M protein [Actinomycetota bacterium]